MLWVATFSAHDERRLAAARPLNVAIYEAYLRGMYHLNKSTEEDLELGMAYCRMPSRRIRFESRPPSPSGAYGLAIVHAALGNTDEALRWLEYDPPHAWVAWSSRDPSPAPLRGDPRFIGFLERMNLPKPLGA